VNLPTNGLLTKRIDAGVGRLIKECPELEIHLNFSLDGLGATHDKIRGVPGNFKKTIHSMELVKEKYGAHPNLHQNVATVVTPEAYDEIFNLGVYLLKKDLISAQFFEVVRGNPLDPETKNLSAEQIRGLRKKIYPLLEEQAKRLFKDLKGVKQKIAKTYFLGFIRFVNELQDANYFSPTDWKMPCTAGETTIVIDHNGAFRSCEIRDAIGNMKEYDFNIKKALYGEVMKKEIAEIGGGKKANCWCTHGCWLMSSIKFSPRAILFRIPWAYYQSKSDRIKDFQLPNINIEAIEAYQ
jgi:MoaA/NifB/PqqE/SkfB family radical SAM enzyme